MNEQVYVKNGKEGEHTVEVILHGTQHRKMYKAFGRKMRITEMENRKGKN